jgi:hypothetical protein
MAQYKEMVKLLLRWILEPLLQWIVKLLIVTLDYLENDVELDELLKNTPKSHDTSDKCKLMTLRPFDALNPKSKYTSCGPRSESGAHQCRGCLQLFEKTKHLYAHQTKLPTKRKYHGLGPECVNFRKQIPSRMAVELEKFNKNAANERSAVIEVYGEYIPVADPTINIPRRKTTQLAIHDKEAGGVRGVFLAKIGASMQ